MEAKSKKVSRLCNCEVLDLLNDSKHLLKGSGKSGGQLATIVYEASQYLQNLSAGQTNHHVRNLLQELNEFSVRFTYKEKLMMVNTIPRTSLDLSLIINEYDDRLTEQQIQDLLSLIEKTSPEPA